MRHDIPLRLTRLRKTPAARALMQETHLHIEQFIYPLFISESLDEKREIVSMPGQYQLTLADIPHEIESLSTLGIQAVLLFGIPSVKDATGSSAIKEDGIVQQAIRLIRRTNPAMLIIADLCFCEHTDHGHCGILDDKHINTDKTLTALGEQAVSMAQAGADWVAPSGMTDGMIRIIRQALDKACFEETAILSYAIKYASSLYGPFREAAQGAPQFGDRLAYQLNPANINEGLREAMLDIEEGADMIMVKPAQYYLDVIHRVKKDYPQIPLCAYQVSGEYTMIKTAAKQGYINEQQIILESLLAIKRAGADFIISYFAKDIAKIIRR